MLLHFYLILKTSDSDSKVTVSISNLEPICQSAITKGFGDAAEVQNEQLKISPAGL